MESPYSGKRHKLFGQIYPWHKIWQGSGLKDNRSQKSHFTITQIIKPDYTD